MLLGLLVIVLLQKIAVSTTIPCKGYLCGDGTCVNGTRCDGVVQCADGSDELRCKRQSSTCDLTCSTSTGFRCVSKCNKIRECNDGSDERDCPGNNELPVAVIVLGSIVGGLIFVIGCPAAIIFIIVYSICKSSKNEGHD